MKDKNFPPWTELWMAVLFPDINPKIMYDKSQRKTSTHRNTKPMPETYFPGDEQNSLSQHSGTH